MKLLLSSVCAAVVLAAGAAHAQTINVAKLSPNEARAHMQLATKLAITSNCLPAGVTDAESKRLNDFADALKAKLKLNDNQFEAQAEKPAFDAYEKDNAGFCKTYIPQVKAFLNRIP
jgi:uncharacterized protein with ATP-grasp and redox domains